MWCNGDAQFQENWSCISIKLHYVGLAEQYSINFEGQVYYKTDSIWHPLSKHYWYATFVQVIHDNIAITDFW